MTLKIGDKVRRRSNGPWTTGTVVAVPRDSHVEVLPDGYSYAPGCAPHSERRGAGTFAVFDLEKIEEPASKFKVGDRVRDRGGETSVVVHPAYPALDATYVRVRFDRNTSSLRHGLYREAELEKVESVPFKLERGDKVVNRKTGREGFVWGNGFVMTEHDYYCTRLSDLRPQDKVPVEAIEEYEEHYPGTYDLIKKDAPW